MPYPVSISEHADPLNSLDLHYTAVNHLLPTKHIQEVKDAALVMAETFNHSVSVNMLCLVLENENIKRSSRMR